MKNRLLLVEGKNDQHVIYALCHAYGIAENVFDVAPAGGVDQRLDSIPVRLKQSDLKRLAVIVDADDDITRTWEPLANQIRKSAMAELPRAPDVDGTCLNLKDGIRFGVWIMPDNRLTGILEDFVARLVPTGDCLLPQVDKFLSDIPPENRRFSRQKQPKSRIHAWLAVQSDPGMPLGQAITAKFLNAQADAVRPFIDWPHRAWVH